VGESPREFKIALSYQESAVRKERSNLSRSAVRKGNENLPLGAPSFCRVVEYVLHKY